MDIQVHESQIDAQVTVVELSGRFLSDAVKALQERLDEVLQQSDPLVVIDFSQVSHLSSATLKVLLNMLKQAKERSGGVAIYGLNPHVEQIMNLAGFDQLLSIAASEEEAVKAIRS